MLSDTHPDAERVQIQLLRDMTGEQRLNRSLDLTATLVSASRDYLTAQHPDWSEDEVKVKSVEIYYGKPLADGVRQRLLAK
jgi:hypothetical protein